MPTKYETLLEALRTLKEECWTHLDCEDCPLHNPGNQRECLLSRYLPYQLDLDRCLGMLKR